MIRVGPEARPPMLTLELIAATVALSAGFSALDVARLRDAQAAR